MAYGRGARTAAAAFAAALVSCGSEVPIPAGARLTCSSARDCPSGFVCHNGGCARADAIDATPPDLAAAPRVAPAVVRAGAEVAIELLASEALAEPPTLTLALEPPVVVPCAAAAGAYRCAYRATGLENGGFGGVVPFDVSLTDRARNAVLRKLAGSVHLDFTPPALAAANVAPDLAPLGGIIQVFFTTSEPLDGNPVLVASRPLEPGGATRLPLAHQPGTLNYGFTHLVTVDAVPGPVDFAVEVMDPAGNGTTLPVGSVTLDVQAPELGVVAVTPARVNGTGTVAAAFDVSEPPATLAVTVGGRPMSCGARQPVSHHHTCTRGMAGDEIAAGTEAAQSVVVEVTDAAGNRRTGSGSVVFDLRPPSLTLAAVSYVPGPDNPLTAVAAAKVGTRIRVIVEADETLAAAPSLDASLAGSSLAFAPVPGTFTGTGVTLEAEVPPGAPDGDYVSTIRWDDVAGNGGTIALGVPAIRVKTSTPTLLVDQDGIVFVRSPWGSAVPEDLGGYVIPAGPYFAIEPGDPLSARTALPPGTFMLAGGAGPAQIRVQLGGTAGARALATLVPAADGTWPRQPLQLPDTPSVHLVAVDLAGNTSAPEQVRNVEWIATANPSGMGTSPHAVVTTPIASPTRVQVTETNGARADDVSGADGRGALAVAHHVWRRVDGAKGIPAIYRPALAYDSARGKVVLFGGREGAFSGGAARPLQGTWEWDGSGWEDVTPAGAKPAAREQAALAYDAARGRVVLFGGSAQTNCFQPLGDTWEWDGRTWRDVSPPGGSPPARCGHSLAYDSARRRVVLLGGSVAIGVSPGPETWEWDGAAWSSVTPPSGSPSPGETSAAYDTARERVVVAGSSVPGVWEWDGTVWTSVAQAAPSSGALAYDPRRRRVLMLGGSAAAVWEWDGASWATVTPAGPSPAPRTESAVAFDSLRGRAVLYGGRVGSANANETWEWDGRAWNDVTPTGLNPSARYRGALAFDAGRGRTVLYGGTGDQATWEWNGNTWRSVTPAGASPDVFRGGAYDAARGRVVLAGEGASRKTWEWDGATWTSVTPAGSTPQWASVRGVTYDSIRRRIALIDTRDTWHWDGASWTTVTPPGVKPPIGHVVFDDGRARLVVYDEAASRVATSTWESDGSTWWDVTPVGSLPPGRSDAAVAFDSIRGRTVVFGGMRRDDSWEWDGAAWRETTPPGARPAARRFHRMAFDSRRGRTVVSGGLDWFDTSLGDTWELDAAPAGHPALQFDASSAGAGFRASSVTRLRVRVHSGATFPPRGAGAGATLLGWAHHDRLAGPGAWVELGSNTHGVAATQPYLGPPGTSLIDWNSATAVEARRFLNDQDGGLSFQLRPSGPSGPDPGEARVALDAIEVRVRYVAP